MGIPHLITFLQPFAARESLCNRRVVIDGPGFAHHIYYICLISSQGARNAFEAAPTYSGLVNAAIAWLDALRESKVHIEKIYFDGFLPPSKMETRLSRLSNSTIRLSQFHAKYSVPCRTGIESLASGTSKLFGTSAARPSLGTLPPLPFLVPAIMEALAESKYAELVEVVPGEADPFCARYVQEHGGTILTGDSDLLVHDVGEDGAVSFFKDILEHEDSNLSSLIYQPSVIAERLALPEPKGLQYLAFEMNLEPHGTFLKLVAQAKLKRSFLDYPTQFAEFIRDYTVTTNKHETSWCETPEVLNIMRKLDPRISEYALQFASLARIAGENSVRQAPEEKHVFLPFILDSPKKTNSWEISATTRQLAYGLINLIVSEADQRAFEHRRRQNKSKGLELQLPTILDMPTDCKSFVSTLVQIREKLPSLSIPDYWLAVAVYEEIEWAFLYGKPSLTESVIREVKEFTDNTNEHLSWDMVHFLGQIQASLYSLRILKQLASLVVAHFGQATPPEVLALHQGLTSLPQLSTLPSFGDIMSLVPKIVDLGMVGVSKELLGISDTPKTQAPVDTETKGKKGKRKRDKPASKKTTFRKKSSNPFDLLDVE